MDNAQNGFSLYQLDGVTQVREYVTGAPWKTHPKQVGFAEGQHVVVGGSDHGKVYIFGRKTGEVLQRLHLGKDELVQTIAVCHSVVLLFANWWQSTQTLDLENETNIITASSDASAKDPTVCVWVLQWQPPTTHSNSSKIPSIYSVMQALRNCIVVGVAIYLLRNTGQKVSLTVLQGKKLTVWRD
jgi:hypothetical protein